jgi:hypothetical protein
VGLGDHDVRVRLAAVVVEIVLDTINAGRAEANSPDNVKEQTGWKRQAIDAALAEGLRAKGVKLRLPWWKSM